MSTSSTLTPPTSPLAPPQRVPLSRLIHPDLDQLLRLAPENPTVRALILKSTRLHLPEDKLTYDACKEWLEANTQFIPAPAATPSGGRLTQLHLPDGYYSGTIRGRCSYFESATSSSIYVDAATIIEFLDDREESELTNDLLDDLNEVIDNEARQDVTLEGDGDCEHDNYSSDDETIESFNLTRSHLIETLRPWLRANAPRLAQRFQV